LQRSLRVIAPLASDGPAANTTNDMPMNTNPEQSLRMVGS
jgi:hypothetical protein